MNLEDKLLQQMEYEHPYITELFGPDKYFNGPLTIEERKLLEEYIHDKNNPHWKAIIIDGTETNYEISNVGEVRNKVSRSISSEEINNSGYLSISINIIIGDKQKYRRHLLHRLVAVAFIPNPENKPEVNHINGIKTCNWYKNLEWVTRKENIQHAIDNGNFVTGINHKMSKHNEYQIHQACKLLENPKIPFTEISKLTGVSIKTITHIRFDNGWNHIAKNYNIPKNPVNKGPKFSKLSNKIIDLILEGKNNKEIYDILKKEEIYTSENSKSISNRIYNIRKINKRSTTIESIT